MHISKLYITSRHYEEIWLFNQKIGLSGPLTENVHLIISIISSMPAMTNVEEAVLNSVVPKMKPYFGSLVLIITLRGGICYVVVGNHHLKYDNFLSNLKMFCFDTDITCSGLQNAKFTIKCK